MRCERVGESVLIDHRAPGGVDDESGGLEEGEPLRIDQVPGRLAERGVHGDVVADAHELVELDAPSLQPVRDVTDLRVGVNNLHVEGGRAAGDQLANVAEPYDPQNLAVQFGDEPLQPGQRPVGLRQGDVPGRSAAWRERA